MIPPTPTPSDRCHGGTAYTRCDRRFDCDRYVDRPKRGMTFLWPMVPGPCDHFRKKDDAKIEK